MCWEAQPRAVASASILATLVAILARGELMAAKARARIDAQLPLLAKVRVATHVVDNDGHLESTKE
jgi:dephospho-CoA kinase